MPVHRHARIALLLALAPAALLACTGSVEPADAGGPSVRPPEVTVAVNGTATFAAATGAGDTAVAWSIQEASGCGQISQAGLYTAPGAAKTCHVVATSVADPTKSATATVTVTACVPAVCRTGDCGTLSDGCGGTIDCGATCSSTWLQGGCLQSALPAPAAGSVQVSPTFTCQTMDGIGVATNVTMLHDLGPDGGLNGGAGILDTVIADLGIKYVRLAPVNWDFGGPGQAGWESPQGSYPGKQSGSDIARYYVPLTKYLQGKGISVSTGVWDTAAWVASGGTPSNPTSLGEYLASYTAWMGQQGAAQEEVEVMNEPDNPQADSNVNRYSAPSQLVSSAAATVTALDAAGLGSMSLRGPDTSMPSQTVDWVTPWCANATLKGRTNAITYHSWWDDQTTADSGVFTDIWNAARACGNKPVWATEVGYCAYEPVCPSGHHFQQDTWSTAWDDALAFYRVLAFSHASRAYYWMLYGWDGAIYVNPSSPTMIAGSDGASLASTSHTNGELLPTYFVLKHFSAFIPAGATYVGSRAASASVLSMAFHRPDGKYTLILINKGTSAATVAVGVAGASSVTVGKMVTSTSGSYYRAATSLPAAGSVALPASSVSSLELTAP